MNNKPIFESKNIEMIRDVCEVIDIKDMVNAYGRYSWGVNHNGLLYIEFEKKESVARANFEGDGVCVIQEIDNAYPYLELKRELFDTHWYMGGGSREAFSELMKKKFDIIIR